jgi:plastocyanin
MSKPKTLPKHPLTGFKPACDMPIVQHILTLLFILLVAAGLATPTSAATITGTVHAEGKPGADADASGGKYESRQFKFVERVNYAEMHDFAVYIEGATGTKPVVPDKPVQVITKRVLQQGAIFTPHILPVLVGTTVEWPNNDKILHNVFSFSEAKPFDLGLYKEPDVGRVTFDKPGRVDVFCSIHTRMSCVILVLENPYFATTNDKGWYSIANVPPGTYKLKAWHERLPSQTQEIVVPEHGEVKVDFALGIKNLPKP